MVGTFYQLVGILVYILPINAMVGTYFTSGWYIGRLVTRGET